MIRSRLNILLGSILIFLLGLLVITTKAPQPVLSATATNVVISEIQIEGATTSDEFVELYNPTDSAIDLTNWTLYRKTAAAVSEEIVLATASGSIPAHGFYLIANTGFDGGITAETTYSDTNISDNNSVLLRDNANVLLDLVGMGTSATSETASIQNPIDNRSIERKALSTSTADDMASGGNHATLGNGEDTDNNVEDFVRHVSPNVSNPQNTTSVIEDPDAQPSPSPEPTPDVSPTPTPEPTPDTTPTPEPSVTPTPSPEVSPSPTPEATPSPTPEPTPEVTPTPEPTPEVSPSPSVEPSVEPSPTPVPSVSPTPTPNIFFQGFLFTCTRDIREFNIGGIKIRFPLIRCGLRV